MLYLITERIMNFLRRNNSNANAAAANQAATENYIDGKPTGAPETIFEAQRDDLVEKDGSLPKCLCCAHRTANTLLDCGHRTTCLNCSRLLRRCPVCRAVVLTLVAYQLPKRHRQKQKSEESEEEGLDLRAAIAAAHTMAEHRLLLEQEQKKMEAASLRAGKAAAKDKKKDKKVKPEKAKVGKAGLDAKVKKAKKAENNKGKAAKEKKKPKTHNKGDRDRKQKKEKTRRPAPPVTTPSVSGNCTGATTTTPGISNVVVTARYNKVNSRSSSSSSSSSSSRS